MGWKRLSLVAAMAGSLALSASAQSGLRDRDRSLDASQSIANDLRKSRVHYGPFYLLSYLQLSDIGYDQQFYVPTADQSTGFSFGLEAPNRLYFVPRKKTVFSVEVTPQWSHFRKGGDRDVWGYKARADAQFLLNHLYVDVYATKNNTLRADIAEIARLLTERSDGIGVTGEMKYSSRTSLKFNAVTLQIKHPLDKIQPSGYPVELLDRSEHNYRASLNHKTFPLTQTFVATEYSDYSFPTAVFKNARRTYGGVGFLYDSGKAVVRLEGGVGRLDFFRTDQHDFKGFLGNLSASRKTSRTTAISAYAARDLDFSIFASNDYYISNRFGFNTTWDATRRLTLNAGTNIALDTYEVPVLGPRGFLRRRDQFSFTSVGWTYALNRLRGGFDVGYVRRTSNFDVNLDHGIRILLRLSLSL